MKNFFYLALMIMFAVSACDNKTSQKLNGEYVGEYTNGFPITIGFDDDKKQVYGRVVNNFFGAFETTGDKLELKNIGATRMMGPPDGMTAEDGFLTFFNNVKSFEIDGNSLILKTPDEEMIFNKSAK